MAIAYDSSGTVGGNSTSTIGITQTISSGSNRLLLVWVWIGNYSANSITSITSNGTPLTMISTNNGIGQGNWTSGWYGLLNPPSGSNSIQINMATSASPSQAKAFSVSYTGVTGQFMPYNVSIGNSPAPANTATVNSNTVYDNSWLVGASLWGGGTLSVGTNTTSRQTNGGNGILVDSNGPKTPAGIYGLQLNATVTDNYVFEIISIAPFNPSSFIATNRAVL
jgi:hypothetical protein